jgi:hypothetical protein
MADIHKKSFWGNKSAIILESPGKKVPYIFLTCIKKKENGEWEKFSQKEGKTIKINIKEIICILEVLKQRLDNWRGYHIFKRERTEIFVYWKDPSKSICTFEIGSYNLDLKFPDNKLLTFLLNHILSEKIEFATSGSVNIKNINIDS